MEKEIIVITGASSGIGAALAKIFSQSGYQLVLLARNKEKMEALNIPNSHCISVDVSDAEKIQKTIHHIESSIGPISCLINNAGYAREGDFTKQDMVDYKKIVDVNVLGLLYSSRAVLPKMQARQSGTIINMSSIAARKVRPSLAVYAATKAAVSSLTESLRSANVQYNIRICNVAPAPIKTPLAVSAGLDMAQAIEPDELAKTVLWIFQQPAHICIQDIVIAATAYAG